MNAGKIFLIDDDPTTLQLYTKALENAGFKVTATKEVIGTVNKINDFSPDVILLDVMMPALSGNKIVKILRESVRSQPDIILLSNKGEDELKKIAKECGADDYITKISGPFSVVRKINEYIFRRKGGRA
jgi:DNA-binding response OmpR family regulator